MLYLHGVVRATHPMPEGSEAGGPATAMAAIRLVGWEDLAAVVSEPSSDGRLTDGDAESYLGMLCALVRGGPVVPLRFGTVAATEQAVRTDVLAPSAAELRRYLERLDGLAECHVYLRFDEAAALRAVFDETPHARNNDVRGADLHERIRAGEMIAGHITTWRRAMSKKLLQPLSARAIEAVALPEREPTEERWAFLIPLSEVETARGAVREIAARAAVLADFVGPLPAYSFLAPPVPAGRAAELPRSHTRWGW
jgi:hypothetical protein